MKNITLGLAIIIVLFIAAACSNAQVANSNQDPIAQPTPSNKFTAADIAKLKWIEGTWRGMDGDKPFYERYKIEKEALVVEGLNADGSVKGEPDRFELKNGEVGNGEGKQPVGSKRNHC